MLGMPYAACSTCVLPSRFLFHITAEGRQTREGRGGGWGGGLGEVGGLEATGLSREGRVGVSVEGGGKAGGGGGGGGEGWGLK